MKKLLSLVIPVMFFTSIHAQTLFTYGTKTVSKTEFIKAFDKNPSADSNRQASLKEYLNLYINFKLKVQVAYDEKLNENEEYKLEAENFKRQLTENAVNEEADINSLMHEAFERSQKDIQLAQVFVEVPKGKDTAGAYKQIMQAYTALKEGKDFGEVSEQFSPDSATKQLKGNMGYITVFSLPYTIENIVYALQAGGYTLPYRSSIGYHIFKKLSERQALGKRKIQQVLLPVPASFSDEEKKAVAQKADSLYALLKAGALFEELQQQYSNNQNENENNNTIEVGVGEYNADFENQVFALQKTGEVSKPFATAYGYNLIKLAAIAPVAKDENDVSSRADIQEKTERDDRLSAIKKTLVEKWLVATKYKPAVYDAKELWAYTDSFINQASAAKFKKINKTTPLFSFANKTITVSEWLPYINEKKQAGDELATHAYSNIMKAFIADKCSEYYRDNLYAYNAALRKQVKEFNDANLLFAVMDKHVWGKAAEDSAGLKKYYDAHLSNYVWAPGASALVITAANKERANEIATKIKNNPSQWRVITESNGANVQADSSRFEQEQLPFKPANPEAGFMSAPAQNTADNTYSFMYITQVYNQPEQRSFDDARGLVINDYQQVIEEKWLTELKKKYPVKVNDAVFATIK